MSLQTSMQMPAQTSSRNVRPNPVDGITIGYEKVIVHRLADSCNG